MLSLFCDKLMMGGIKMRLKVDIFGVAAVIIDEQKQTTVAVNGKTYTPAELESFFPNYIIRRKNPTTGAYGIIQEMILDNAKKAGYRVSVD